MTLDGRLAAFLEKKALFFSHCNAHNNKIIVITGIIISYQLLCTLHAILEIFVVVVYAQCINLLLLVSDSELEWQIPFIRHLPLH